MLDLFHFGKYIIYNQTRFTEYKAGNMGKLSTAVKAGATVIELGHNSKDLRGAAAGFRAADKKQLGRDAGHYAFKEGAETGKTMGKTWLKTFEVIPRMICRSLQFILAIVACGFYGNRVDADRKEHHGFAPEWLFAITVAGLSAMTAILFIAVGSCSSIPFIGSKMKILKTYRAFAWDTILFIAWLVVFGIFAAIFLKRPDDKPFKGSSVRTMKTAVWVDLVNSFLWMVSAMYGCFKTFLGDKMDKATDKAGNKMFSKKKKGNDEGTEMKYYAESV